MIELKLTISGVYQGKKFSEDMLHIGQFRKFLGDWKPAFKLIAHDVLERFWEKQFESEGAAGGEPWQELADSTLAGRGPAPYGAGCRKSRESAGILYRSGDLARSGIEGESGHVEEITDQRLLWGSSVGYALFHQTGTGKGFGKSRVSTGPGTGRGMPMRKMLVITRPMTNDIMLAMQAHLQLVARQVGYGILGRGATPPEAKIAGLARLI